MSETGKAVQEVAKTASKVVDLTGKIGAFFAKAMGESVEAASGMLADTLRYKRWERQILLVEKASALLASKGLSDKHRTVSPKLALPILQGASLEDEDSMHTLWARLLARSMDPGQPTTRTALPDILRQLEPVDVALLDSMHQIYQERIEYRRAHPIRLPPSLAGKPVKRPPTFVSIRKHDILAKLNVDIQDYWTAVDNLCRLGLCDSYIEEDFIEAMVDKDGETESFDVVTSHGGYDVLCITAMGIAMIETCKYGSGPNNTPEPIVAKRAEGSA